MIRSSSEVRSGPVRLAVLVVASYTLLFTWVFADPILRGTLLAESDLHEYFLPIFLAPITTWSSWEFAGLPAFADPGDYAFYPPALLARLLGSWTALAASAHVLGASFTFAYVYVLTRSRSAAAFAGLAYGLSEAMVERLAHLGFLHAIAWLPLIVLSLDRLRGDHRFRWTAIGAIAMACCFLSGHPQPAIYTYYCAAAYALVGGWVERAPRRYYAAVAAMFVVAGLLVGIKLLPFVEASLHMNRQAMSYEQFVSFANSWPQMLSVLFPTISHEGREAPTYVGLATLLFASVGALTARRNWRATFWLVTTIVALALGVGDGTPLARVVYMFPLEDNFRVAARHLFLAAFGAAVLAGFGIATVQARGVRFRSVAVASFGLLLVVGAGMAVVAGWSQYFQLENTAPVLGVRPPMAGLVVQAILAAASAALALVFGSARARNISLVLLLAVLAVDLCSAAGDPVTARGFGRKTIPREMIQPSVHTAALASHLVPEHQRLLAVGGTSVDALVPGAFARLWRIDIAGGYGPMLLASHATLASMGASGGVTLERLAPEDTSLDLLAVKYAAIKPADLPARDTFDRAGLMWNTVPLDVSIGPSDCGHKYSRSVSLAVPRDVEVSSVAVVARLRCSEHVAQGAEVGSVSVVGIDGSVHTRRLQAGVDIAQERLDDPAIAERAQHRPTALFEQAGGQHSGSLVRIALPQPTRATRVVVHGLGTGGWIVLDYLTLVDRSGRSLPQAVPDIFLDNPSRWRAVTRFSTSRASDRGRDVEAEGEQEHVVYENVRAMPRAWIVSEVLPLSDYETLMAIHHGHLPDGRRFDPRRMALVDRAGGLGRSTFPDETAHATVRDIDDGRITVDVSTAGGGFLVLSDSFYPGWRVHIDDQPAALVRADLSLRGVLVPAGGHTVVFTFWSRTQHAGAALTAIGLICCGFLLVRDRGAVARAPIADAATRS